MSARRQSQSASPQVSPIRVRPETGHGTRSRSVRWQEAGARTVSALEELAEIQGEYQEWRDNLPEGLDASATAEKLDAIAEIDIERRRGALGCLGPGTANIVRTREVLGWDAWAGDSGIMHANAVELGGTPESAIALVMERAVQKYGPQDWSTWEFRAEPVPKASGADVVRFVWRDGVLRIS